jgi:pimeloyl-ACP methyl ester carboxylesterase
VNRIFVFCIGLLLHVCAHAELQLVFSHSSLTDGREIRLETFEYVPANWNGKVIIMSHGSTGGNDKAIKASTRFLNISKFALDNGYVFVVYMRKGRGKSEGDFTEETGRCDYGSLTREVAEAEAQLGQVISQVGAKHSVSKVILMGHSRGGFLSSIYAGRHPGEVQAVVNLAGAWSAACESRNGGVGRRALEESAKAFRPQFWAYFENDSYFAQSKFADPEYAWFKDSTSANGVRFKVFGDAGRKDGHEAPTWVPKDWAGEFFPLLNAIPASPMPAERKG